MRFSVVIPSYLGHYHNAARNREDKILRAINSVFNQSFTDYEVIVVADGCEKTMGIVGDIDVRSFLIPKSRTWSGEPRNKGIEEAQGDYIIYLDIDDIYGTDHLKNVEAGIGDNDWVWYDDIRYSPRTEEWYENPCYITKLGRHGTSNICHRRWLPVRWDHVGYAHDYYFVQQLLRYPKYAKIPGAEYYVCHLPGAGGYDL